MTEVLFSQTVDIPDDVLWDIYITATEGGINYWCDGVTVGAGKSHREALISGHTINVHTFEDGTYYLTKSAMLSGIIKFCNLRNYSPLAFGKEDWYDIIDLDAEVADIIVQYAVFGDVIYG